MLNNNFQSENKWGKMVIDLRPTVKIIIIKNLENDNKNGYDYVYVKHKVSESSVYIFHTWD